MILFIFFKNAILFHVSIIFADEKETFHFISKYQCHQICTQKILSVKMTQIIYESQLRIDLHFREIHYQMLNAMLHWREY